MQRSKFRLEANSQFERRPHFCYERPLGRTRAQQTHSEANGSGRHVDAARANRSADRREELVLALRIPVADLYGECFRLDPMPRARAGGISEELLAVLERLGVAHLRVVMLTARPPGAFVSGDERKWP
jgi:hypothetical protein